MPFNFDLSQPEMTVAMVFVLLSSLVTVVVANRQGS
jgi:hypothetical protein